MFTVCRVLATCVFLILSLQTAFAVDWVANQVRQPAKYTIDGTNWVEIHRGTVMPASSWIHTGQRGRLVLNRGKEIIQFKPNTMAAIAKRNKSGTKTLIRQQFGSLLLDV
ncbi:MAG: hypothetical protein COC00_009360, partial [Rhizobiales bacterium]|nr:hypothetical protein [Hyphomicrobiales bacterium]